MIHTDFDPNQCCVCFRTYEEDVLEETELNWIKCVCERLVHKDCVNEIIMDKNGRELIGPLCVLYVGSLYAEISWLVVSYSYNNLSDFLCVLWLKICNFLILRKQSAMYALKRYEYLLIMGNFPKKFYRCIMEIH